MGKIRIGGDYAAYLRKSRVDIEAEARGMGETLARHEEILRRTARALGINIVDWYREVVSGDTIAERPQMRRLMADVNAGMWAGVLVVDIDRLGRGDSVDQGMIFQSFLYSNTLIVTPDKIYDPQDDADAEFFEIKLFFSRREYTMIKKRMQRGRIESVLDGWYLSPKAPYGYRHIKLHKKGHTLEIVPEEKAVVETAYMWAGYGIDGELLGSHKIADRLNSMGYRRRSGSLWSPDDIRRMLTDPTYKGMIRWNQRKTQVSIRDGVRLKTRPLSDDMILVPGKHPAIVSEEVWDLVRHNMRSRAIVPRPANAEIKSPFVGLIFCGECGRALSRKPDPRRGYDVMCCTTQHCPTCSSILGAVEAAVLASLETWVKEYEAEESTTVAPASAQTAAIRQDAIRQLSDKRHTAEAQIEKLYDLLEQGIYTPDMYRSRRAELESRIAEIDRSIGEIVADTAPDTRAQYIPKVRSVLAAYSTAETAAEKNRLLKTVVSKVIYHKTQRGYRNSLPGDNLTIDVFPTVPKAKKS